MLLTDIQTDRQTDRQTDKQTNATENIISLSEIFLNHFLYVCFFAKQNTNDHFISQYYCTLKGTYIMQMILGQ